MKIEGIPTHVEACHHHDVNIRLHLDKETTENVKDIAETIILASVAAYAMRVGISTIIEIAWRWPVKK